jgi:rhodanese-related sulfurtransferase
MSIQEISAQEFSEMVKKGHNLNILDVRTGIECRSEKLACNFLHIPLHELNPNRFVAMNEKTLGNKPLYILCRSGGRARKAAESLERAGMGNLVIVQGGLGACAECNVPIKKGAAWSLERQVRFVAGFLILIGVLMGHFLNYGFYILPGFISAGLMFAAVTEWCGMAMLLAHAPWNRSDVTKDIQKSIQSFEQKT